MIIPALCQYNGSYARGIDSPDNKKYGPIKFDVLTYWTEDTSVVQIAVLYRLNPNFLFFTKTDDGRNLYEAKGEMGIEIQDEKGITIAHDFRMIDVKRDSYSGDASVPQDTIGGIFVAAVGNKKHKIVLYAKDNASGKSVVEHDDHVDFREFSKGLNISSIAFSGSTFPDPMPAGVGFRLANYGGQMIIGNPGGCVFQILSEDTVRQVKISWNLENRMSDDGTENVNYTGDSCLQFPGTPVFAEMGKNIFIAAGEKYAGSRIIFIPLPLKRLEPGSYKLTVKGIQDTSKSSRTMNFEIVWPQQPRSLSNPGIAVNALQHIASREEIDKMTGLSRKKAKNAFHEFWQKFNPDTTCAYNPVMAEYYRRVDEAIKKYSSKDELDGYLTDRGRIFILFGSPSSTNRFLKPNSPPTEIWTYLKQKRRFTFVDRKRDGTYILVEAEIH
jgi:GWxTD domain-containing protein